MSYQHTEAFIEQDQSDRLDGRRSALPARHRVVVDDLAQIEAAVRGTVAKPRRNRFVV